MELSIDDLFNMEDVQLRQEHGRTPDPDVWRWSPFDIRKFDGMLDMAAAYYIATRPSVKATKPTLSMPISFAEAGSGVGTKLYLAKHKYGMIEYGYELFDYYIEKARQLGVQCEQRDLSDFDNQPIWSKFDIVYIARPFKDDNKEQAWEKLVQEQMRPGAIFMSTFSARKPYNWLCLYRATFRGIWVKPVPSPDVDPSLVSSVTIG